MLAITGKLGRRSLTSKAGTMNNGSSEAFLSKDTKTASGVDTYVGPATRPFRFRWSGVLVTLWNASELYGEVQILEPLRDTEGMFVSVYEQTPSSAKKSKRAGTGNVKKHLCADLPRIDVDVPGPCRRCCNSEQRIRPSRVDDIAASVAGTKRHRFLQGTPQVWFLLNSSEATTKPETEMRC